MKKLFVLCLFFIANTCNAQAINDRWLGSWRSAEGQIVQFTSREVLYEKGRYAWMGSMPKKEIMNKNMAFYYGTVSKNDFSKDYREISSNELKNHMKQQEIVRYQYLQTQTKIALKNISNDTFRTIKLTNSTYIGDDGYGFFILDKDNIYAIQGNYSDSFTPTLVITTFFKDN